MTFLATAFRSARRTFMAALRRPEQLEQPAPAPEVPMKPLKPVDVEFSRGEIVFVKDCPFTIRKVTPRDITLRPVRRRTA